MNISGSNHSVSHTTLATPAAMKQVTSANAHVTSGGHVRSSLAVVPLEDILIHEVHDSSRADPLAKIIAQDGILRHPVILARNHDGPLVHLDGANRLTALAQLGCQHIVAQVVDYGDPAAVRLDTWIHLTALNNRGLVEAAEGWSHCEVDGVPADQVSVMLAQGQAAAAVLFDNGETFVLRTGLGLSDRVETLHQLTDLYAEHTIRETLPDGGNLLNDMRDLLNFNSHQAKACIAFAPLTKADVITLAWNMKTRLPAGITRHIILCGRVLNVNAPLDLLKAKFSVIEKTALLHEMLASRRRRVYSEPTVAYEDY